MKLQLAVAAGVHQHEAPRCFDTVWQLCAPWRAEKETAAAAAATPHLTNRHNGNGAASGITLARRHRDFLLCSPHRSEYIHSFGLMKSDVPS